MSAFTPGRRTLTQGEEIARVFIAGEEARFIFGRGTQVFPNLPVPIYGATAVRMATDDDAVWFEFGFQIDAELDGNAAAGFTDAGNYIRIEIEQSTDLVNWNMGKFVPAAVPVTDNLDGTYTYWSRGVFPRLWKYVTIDLTATTTRYGKSITAVQLFGSTLALPNYPYAMPAAAATLQADLRALGYSGATVTSTSAPLTARAINHTVNGNQNLPVTMSGTSVSMVKNEYGSNITLPGYPYAMPAQQATLQAALRTAGYTGAVVMLFADEWEVFIPDRDTILGERRFDLTITPGDPYPHWDFFGTYLGLAPATTIPGVSGNVRATTGLAPLEEAARQFARLKLTTGTRYQP
jgi:hypothetical protein